MVQKKLYIRHLSNITFISHFMKERSSFLKLEIHKEC